MSDHPADWHRHLQTLRIALDMSVRDAAALCKMSPTVYGEIERGVDGEGMDPERFARFARTLLRPTRERIQKNATEFRAKIDAAMRRR